MPRMRSFSGSSSPAKISVAESNPSSPSGTGGGEGDAAMATTPASSASDLRLVRTGDTTIPSGVQTRNRKKGDSKDSFSLEDSFSSSMVPAVPSQVQLPPSSSAQAAEADGGLGMFSAALGTIKEWTNDLMTAPDRLNLTSPTAADGGGEALGELLCGDDNNREVGNANVDGKSKSNKAGSKLRAAVRSLSPLGRDKVAMNRMKQKLVKAKKAMGASPDRRSSPNRSSSSGGAAATSTSKRDLQDQFRTKLQVQTNYDVHGELLNTKDHPNDNEDDDGRARGQKQKKRSGSAGATAAKGGARKGQQKEQQQQPTTLGPVQFLQHMMSTNCMAGTGLSDLLKEDEESEDGGESNGSSSYDYSSSAVSASSEDTGQSSGKNRRQRQQKGRSSRGRQTKASSQSMNTSNGVKVVNKNDKRNRRSGSSSGSRGGSKQAGRPDDIPEEETEEDSAAAAVARLEAEDLNVIGRRPGVGVVRDDGSPTSKQRTPKQTNRKSIRPAVSEKEGSYVTQLRLFSKVSSTGV